MNTAGLNHHLFLRNGIWWTRVKGSGLEERHSTGVPRSEVAAARRIRDQRLAVLAERREGTERPARPLTLGELLALYIAEEAQQYDRAKGGEQPGTKRSAESDKGSKKRVLRHISPNLSAATINREMLFDLARACEREVPALAPGTRRKLFAFVRRVFSWATEHPSRTGVERSPFASLSRQQRAQLFPRVGKRGYIYSPDELRAVYELLPAYERPFVRFAVHTAMRLREITTLTWGNVNPERRTVRVEARFAKNGRDREVPLGDVALEILEALRPVEAQPDGHVFLGRHGSPIRDLRGGFEKAVVAVWKPSKPGEKKPRFHDLRKTCATRVEAVSSYAVAKALLGHADSSVTDTYLMPTLDAVRDALNRAARSIDGEPPVGAIPFAPKAKIAEGAHQGA